MKVAVIDYDGGNLASAAGGLAEAARRAGIAADVSITRDVTEIATADRIVLPGQGAFADCARGLAAVPGLKGALETAVDGGTPFLGICVGMQLMAERGREHGVTPGLGWITGEIRAMDPPGLRLPHMGWNSLAWDRPHPLLDGLTPGDHVYFTHSYALAGADARDVVAETAYGGPVAALVVRGNRAGTQFHVEKSQSVGLRLLANFLTWAP